MKLFSFFSVLALALVSCALGSCGGGGGSGAAQGFNEERDVGGGSTPNAGKVNISGTLTMTTAIVSDSDSNDPLSDYSDNSSFETAQNINNFSSVHGFLTETATDFGNDVFEQANDEVDVYRVALQKGQQILLQIVDYSSFADQSARFSGDVDLALFNEERELLLVSESETEYEVITVPDDGVYYVAPYIFSGASKYVLQFTSAVNRSAVSDSERSVTFVPGEAIVKLSVKMSALRARSIPSQSDAILLSSTLSHPSITARAALVKFDDSAPLRSNKPFTRSAQSGGLEENSKLQTLIKIKRLRQSPDVEYAEPNYIRQASIVPDDTFYSYQWHYAAMNLPQAWDITTGRVVASSSQAGWDVIVAVIDTGVLLSNPDLAGQLVAGYDFIRETSLSLDGDGIDNNPDDPGDATSFGESSWHGTHVAGTIAAKTNNGIGVSGVSWGAKIMPIRVLGKGGGGTDYDIDQGIRYAAGLANDSNTLPQQRADIINLSLGGPDCSSDIEEVFKAIHDSGVIIVAAAGNENTSRPSCPASYDGVISVSALDFANQRAPYSNFGSRIDIAAPGGDKSADLNGDGYSDGVLSILVDDSSGQRKPVYDFYQGTSMASPHVAGLLALMKAVYPALTAQQVDALLANGDLTRDAGAPGRDDIYGYGIADALLAVQAAQRLANGGAAPELPPSLVASPAAINIGNAITATAFVSNHGGGKPSLTSVIVNDAWLSVSAINTDAQGLGAYQFVVDRTGLVDGLYVGNVTFNFGSNVSLQLSVTMTVGSVQAEGGLSQLYTFLFDPFANNGQGAIVAQAMTDTDRSRPRYRFSNIDPGSYYIISGSDIDNDGIVCQTGEICGSYPVLSQPVLIEVDGDMENINFAVGLQSNLFSTRSALNSNSGSTIPEMSPVLQHLKRLDHP